MFYTPGWGAIFTLTGTLGGVAVTQIANSAVGRTARRKERNERRADAVTELVATGTRWMYAMSTQEQDLIHAIQTQMAEADLIAMLKSARAACYDAEVDYARALAGVRLKCQPVVVSAAETYNQSLIEFARRSRDKGAVVLARRRVDASEVPVTSPEMLVKPMEFLIRVSKEVTGYSK